MADVIEVTGTLENNTGLYDDLMAVRLDVGAKNTLGLPFLGGNPLTHHAVGLFDSRGAVDGVKDIRKFGTLVGIYSLSTDVVNNTDPILGSLGASTSKVETLDANTTKFTYVGEFGTTQAVGTFDRMVLFGATKENSEYRKTAEELTYYPENAFQLSGRTRLDGFTAPDAGSKAPYLASRASYYSDLTNGWLVAPKTLNHTTEYKVEVSVAGGICPDLSLSTRSASVTTMKDLEIPLPEESMYCWDQVHIRIAPNGDVYVFDSTDFRTHISVIIIRQAGNWTNREYTYLRLPELFNSRRTLQFRIDDDGVLTTFHTTEDAPTVLKLTKYSLDDLSNGTPYLSLDMGRVPTNKYFINDLVYDETNQVAHLFINKHRGESNSSSNGYNIVEKYSSGNVTSVMYDLTGSTAPIVNGIASVGTINKSGIPSLDWAFGGWGEAQYSNVLDGGSERVDIDDYGQCCYIFDHKRQVMRAFQQCTYKQKSAGDISEWTFCPAPHFTSALSVVDIPAMTKNAAEQLRAILEVTVTHN